MPVGALESSSLRVGQSDVVNAQTAQGFCVLEQPTDTCQRSAWQLCCVLEREQQRKGRGRAREVER